MPDKLKQLTKDGRTDGLTGGRKDTRTNILSTVVRTEVAYYN